LGSSSQEAQGSGFLIDNQGHILTNNHVVDQATSVEVVLGNSKDVEAKVVGTDAADDLALIQIDTSAMPGVTPVTLGNSDAVKPGQMAIAIGNPYGLDDSITVGVISGLDRTLTSSVGRPITGLLQTDAAINPGNSGGPLLNSQGEVIGINTAIENPMTGAQGIGFAVPINTAKDQLQSLLQGQNIKRPWLGISGTAITSDLVQKLSLTVDQGVYVITATADSPAEKAGIKGSGTDSNGDPVTGGDIITAVDGTAVKKVEDLVSYFNTKKAGDNVLLNIIRDGKTMQVLVTLGTWPDNVTTSQQSQATPTPTPTPKIWQWQYPWSSPR
jgi:S1-C subfamily serine protease